MPTLSTLVADGHLLRWELDEADERQPIRIVAIHPDFRFWLDRECPDTFVDRAKSMTPSEQIVDALDRLTAEPRFPHAGQMINIQPQKHGVYEIKTTDARVFGFFPDSRQFVAVTGALKMDLKHAPERVNAIRQQVRTIRQALCLDFRRHMVNLRDELL